MITWGQFNSLRGSRYGPLGFTSAWFRRALGGYTPQEGADEDDEDEDNKCIQCILYIHFTRVRMEVLVLIGLHLRHNVITNREKNK